MDYYGVFATFMVKLYVVLSQHSVLYYGIML